MKKLFFLLLLPFWMTAQISNGTETEFEALKVSNPQTVTATDFITTTGTDGTQGKVLGENITVTVTPPTSHYVPLSNSIKGHLQGIDQSLGNLATTTAGITNRIYFTGDTAALGAGTFYLSNPTGKGSVATVSQLVTNGDDQKQYFAQDVISSAFSQLTTAPSGVFSGQLSVQIDSNIAQQRYTVEIYRTNNSGTPIASGVTGAPVGSLGVTVVGILDSGLLNLVANNLSQITVTGTLLAQFTGLTGERLRYHISAEKVGTAGANIAMQVFYGSNHNSFYDAPVTFDTNSVLNRSTVLGTSTTNALDNLNSKIPTDYSKIVYVNAANPNSATIFDLNNPPITNDNLLKTDVNNLYIGSDASTWVYNGAVYVTKTVTSTTSNFYLYGTTTDAGASKTAPIIRSGNMGTSGRFIVGAGVPTETNIWVTRDLTGSASSQSILVDGVIKSDVTTAAFLNRTRARTQAVSFTLPDLYHFHARQETFGAGSIVTNQYGYFAEASLIGGVNNYGFYGDIPTAANRWNLYMNGTAPSYFNGAVGIGTNSPLGKLNIVTGTGSDINVSSQLSASIVLGNLGTGGNETPAISGRTSNNTGLTLVAASAEANTTPDMRLEIRRNDNTDYTDRTTVGFRFTRFGTTLINILRNGNTTFFGTVAINGETASTIASFDASKNLKSLSTATYPSLTELSYVKGVTGPVNTTYAAIASPTFTGDPKAPTATAGDSDTSIATTAFVQASTRPYKTYTAVVTQSGTSAPTATVLENTTGGTITFSRLGVGAYTADITGASYTVNKTCAILGPTTFSSVNTVLTSTSQIGFGTNNSTTGANIDGALNKAMLEIRIYN